MSKEKKIQFNLMVPCHVKLASEKEPLDCRLNLMVSEKELNIFFHKFDSPKPLEAHFSEWRFLNATDTQCVFLNENRRVVTIIYFINDSRNMRRFLFALTEACVLVLSSFFSLNMIDIMPKHSFVPSGNYSFINDKIPIQIRSILHNQIISISDTNMPGYLPCVGKIANMFHAHSLSRENQWVKKNQNDLEKYHSLTRKKILIFLEKDLKVWNQDKLKESTSLFENFEADDKTYPVIEKDAKRMNTYDNKSCWCDKYCKICTRVCKMHVFFTKICYLQGNFDLVKMILLLLKGESSIPNDNLDLPDFFDKINHKDLEIYVYLIYSFIKKSINTNEPELKLVSAVTETVSNMILEQIFPKTIPQIVPYFLVHKLTLFLPAGEFYSSIFCRSVQNIWPLWCWILNQQNPLAAFSCFYAAIIYFSFPEMTTQADILNFMTQLKIKDFWATLDCACYFYKRAGFK